MFGPPLKTEIINPSGGQVCAYNYKVKAAGEAADRPGFIGLFSNEGARHPRPTMPVSDGFPFRWGHEFWSYRVSYGRGQYSVYGAFCVRIERPACNVHHGNELRRGRAPHKAAVWPASSTHRTARTRSFPAANAAFQQPKAVISAKSGLARSSGPKLRISLAFQRGMPSEADMYPCNATV